MLDQMLIGRGTHPKDKASIVSNSTTSQTIIPYYFFFPKTKKKAKQKKKNKRKRKKTEPHTFTSHVHITQANTTQNLPSLPLLASVPRFLQQRRSVLYLDLSISISISLSRSRKSSRVILKILLLLLLYFFRLRDSVTVDEFPASRSF